MDDWFKRAALSTFVGLTAAIVAGGSIVMAGAAIGRWIITTYPPEVALPGVVLGTLLVATGLAFAAHRAFGPQTPAPAADPLHQLLARIGTDHPGGLLLAAFVAGLALSLHPHHPPRPTDR